MGQSSSKIQKALAFKPRGTYLKIIHALIVLPYFLDPNVLKLKIHRFPELSREFNIFGEPVYISGLQWKLQAKVKIPGKVGLFIHCKSASEEKNWTCSASYSLRIKSHRWRKPDKIKNCGKQQQFKYKHNISDFAKLILIDVSIII